MVIEASNPEDRDMTNHHPQAPIGFITSGAFLKAIYAEKQLSVTACLYEGAEVSASEAFSSMVEDADRFVGCDFGYILVSDTRFEIVL
jgi:hypothetical protein